MAPLAIQAYYPSRPVVALLWAAVLQGSLRDVWEQHHYSVDMLLAVVVTWAVWTWCGRGGARAGAIRGAHVRRCACMRVCVCVCLVSALY